MEDTNLDFFKEKFQFGNTIKLINLDTFFNWTDIAGQTVTKLFLVQFNVIMYVHWVNLTAGQYLTNFIYCTLYLFSFF